MTVRELLHRIDARELAEWAAYERVAGPLGPERGDLHAALVAATVFNMLRGKGRRALRVEEFLLRFDRPRQQSWQEQLATIERLNTMLGGQDRRGNDRKPAGPPGSPGT